MRIDLGVFVLFKRISIRIKNRVLFERIFSGLSNQVLLRKIHLSVWFHRFGILGISDFGSSKTGSLFWKINYRI